MAAEVGAGDLRSRLHFQVQSARDPGEPDYGSPQAGPWETIFTCRAKMVMLRGTESVMANRLTGIQPYKITIRSCRAARMVTPGWRIVDARDERRIFEITAVGDPTRMNAWVEMLATDGGAG